MEIVARLPGGARRSRARRLPSDLMTSANSLLVVHSEYVVELLKIRFLDLSRDARIVGDPMLDDQDSRHTQDQRIVELPLSCAVSGLRGTRLDLPLIGWISGMVRARPR